MFAGTKVPIVHDVLVYLEHRIRLKDKSALSSHHKIYSLDQEELAKLKN